MTVREGKIVAVERGCGYCLALARKPQTARLLIFTPFAKRRPAEEKARRVAGRDAGQFDVRAGCLVGEPP